MYYLFLGHSASLALAELSALGLTPESITPNLAITSDPRVLELAGRLGGTVKIATAIATCNRGEVMANLATVLGQDTAKNVAITDYADLGLSRTDLHSLKSSVTRPIRFVSMETTPHELIMLLRQHVLELNLIKTQRGVAIARTDWIQDGGDWSTRDRYRPYQDIKRGMLPPKIARVMVNLASHGESGTLLDPFCGTGTVLMEALLSGLSVIGSDNDEKAIEGTQANLNWLHSHYQLPTVNYQLVTSDATHIASKGHSVNYIVTEPYMGPLLDTRKAVDFAKAKDIARGLDKLYRGCLRDWHNILSDNGRVVMIFPEFHIEGRVIPTTSVDTIAGLGYNILSQLPYSKPGTTVVRNITIMEKI